jgi:drug/metabolite transporter (DMT)-like permease
MALSVIPGLVVFPLNGVSIIALTILTRGLIWKEKPKPHHYLFFAMAGAAVVLLSI